MEAWLRAGLAYLPEWLGFQLRQSEQAGCILAVAHRGELVLERAFGAADLSSGEGLTPRHRFRVASHSKSFTAAGIMLLRQQGRLRLDDAVGQHLAGLHPEVAGATIAQLLSHTAGVTRDGTTAGQFSDQRPFATKEEVLADLASGAVIEPNTRFKYSNHGYALLGLVIEAVTGEPYRDWIRREVVAAFGLGETEPDMPLPPGTPFTRGHSGKWPVGQRLVIDGENPAHAIAPAGGFVSTAADLVGFFSRLSPRAEASPLSVASRREMVRRQWRNPHASLETWYGLGTISGTLGDWAWFGHSGRLQGYVSRTVVVPEQEIAVSILVNGIDGTAEPWVDGALQILRGFAQRGAPAEAVRGWTGRWWTPWGATDLLPMGERVLMALPSLWNPLLDASEIEVTGPEAGRIALAAGYASHGEAVRLLRDAAGRPTEFHLGGTGCLPEAAMAEEMQARYRMPRPG